MKKPLLIIIILALLGALAIAQFSITLPASIAFVIGMVIASLVFVTLGSSNAANATQYKGPTKTLYVGNLPYRVHESEVNTLFTKYGPVKSVRLVRDRKTGRRKGFGFVEMSANGALKAMNELNDYTFQERSLKVREARSQESHPQRDAD
ncbi:MAG: RNA recognition motif domain-containing protein [Parashewanella sp.]